RDLVLQPPLRADQILAALLHDGRPLLHLGQGGHGGLQVGAGGQAATPVVQLVDRGVVLLPCDELAPAAHRPPPAVVRCDRLRPASSRGASAVVVAPRVTRDRRCARGGDGGLSAAGSARGCRGGGGLGGVRRAFGGGGGAAGSPGPEVTAPAAVVGRVHPEVASRPRLGRIGVVPRLQPLVPR